MYPARRMEKKKPPGGGRIYVLMGSIRGMESASNLSSVTR